MAAQGMVSPEYDSLITKDYSTCRLTRGRFVSRRRVRRQVLAISNQKEIANTRKSTACCFLLQLTP